jgi:hypothetical protein
MSSACSGSQNYDARFAGEYSLCFVAVMRQRKLSDSRKTPFFMVITSSGQAQNNMYKAWVVSGVGDSEWPNFL